jgi:hypothetical protein
LGPIAETGPRTSAGATRRFNNNRSELQKKS